MRPDWNFTFNIVFSLKTILYTNNPLKLPGDHALMYRAKLGARKHLGTESSKCSDEDFKGAVLKKLNNPREHKEM